MSSTSFTDLARRLVRQKTSERREGRMGIPALDSLLPQGAWNGSGLVEWLADAGGGGVSFMLLMAAHALRLRNGTRVVVIDPQQQFHPAAVPAWGIPLERLVIIRPGTAAESLWAWEQTLRCRGVAACLGPMPEVATVALRRLQLAAEQGAGLGLLLRPRRIATQPSWASLRWSVTSLSEETSGWSQASLLEGRRFRVELVRCRGQFSGGVACVEFTHHATPVSVVSPVAHPALPLRATGS